MAAALARPPSAGGHALDTASRPLRAQRVPALVVAVTALTVAAGLGARARGLDLGAPLPPFLASWHPDFDLTALPAAVVLLAGVVLAPRLLCPSVPPAAFAAATLLVALVLRLALAGARDGAASWYAVFGDHGEGKNEYRPALAALAHGPRWFLDRFAELVPALPVHAAGHPPGLLLAMHVLDIDSAAGLAALTIAVGVLVVPLTYGLGQQLLAEPAGRVAALLVIFAPSALLYGATSADALFATIGLAAASALVARRAPVRAVGALLLAIASFFSYALLAVGAWATLAVARREGIRSAAVLGLACALALTAFYAALYAASGFDVVGALAATDQVYGHSIARLRPYAYWVFGSPAAFLVALGLPVAWYAVRALAARQTVALALGAVILAAAVLGFSKAETERIWLFLVPLACVAAAGVLPARRLPPVLALLAVQALAAELFLGTIW